MTVKVVVAIEIESCQECPHFYSTWGDRARDFCLEEEKSVPDYRTIPEWCPFLNKLEEIDEKILNS